MINKLEITGVHLEVNDDLHKYVAKKIGKLDKYMSKHARESVHVVVKLKETKGKAKDRVERTCEVIVHLPHDNLAISEKTASVYAAIDIVEQKLKAQLQKYKELHGTPRFRHRVLAKFKRRPAEAL
jgi:putative sigma-54 modulation protein